MEDKTATTTILTMMFVLLPELVKGAVYNVGDDAGWTLIGSPNYTAWAESKRFKVGDTILFKYSNMFHNVLQVSEADFGGCNASSPFEKYSSGNDSVRLTSEGHFFFMCGFPGHCGSGMKLNIRVDKSSHSGAPSPSPYSIAWPPSPAGCDGAPAPAITPSSDGVGAFCKGPALVVAVISFAVVWLF